MADLDAAIEAATTAIHDVDCEDGSACPETRTTWGRYGRYACAALAAAAPLIRTAERAKVRAELLAMAAEYDAAVLRWEGLPPGPSVQGEYLRVLADRIAPEPKETT